MAESQVVSGLVAKRGELAGEVERHRRELQPLGEELGHLDATIRLFDPSYALGAVGASKGAIAPKGLGQARAHPPHRRHPGVGGRAHRLVAGTLGDRAVVCGA